MMQGHRAFIGAGTIRTTAYKVPPIRGHRTFIEPKIRGFPAMIDRFKFNALRASRKADREAIADALERICRERGATVTERRNEPANLGYSGQGIALRIESHGVGCMIDIDDLHGGEWSLIHWFNTEYPPRNFSNRFCGATGNTRGATGCERPHHKSTSHPSDWHSLAMMLDSGLMLAARGEAFEPVKAEASAT